MENESEVVKDLISIILDPSAADHEKDDAAMDLVDYNNAEAFKALLKSASNPSENDIFALPQYGETIGVYWVKNGGFNKNIFFALSDEAKGGVLAVFLNLKPEWIKQYKLL